MLRSSPDDFGNDVWEKKLTRAFHTFDFNRDGVLEQKDLLDLADSIATIGHLSEVQKKQMERKFQRIWVKFFSEFDKNGVNLEDFLKAKKAQGRDAILMGTTILHTYLFDAVDTNGNGYIEPKEFGDLFKALKIEADAEEAFKALDTDHDGKLNADEFVASSVDYFCNGDKDSHSKHLYGYCVE